MASCEQSGPRPAESVTSGCEGVCDGVVAYAGVDWWYHPHGHSECQILSRLARRIPVLWVNSIGMRAPSFSKTGLALSRYWRKIKSTSKLLRRDPCGMWIYSPIFVPRYTPRMVEVNGRLLASQVRILCRALGIKRPAAWVTVPTAVAAIERGSWTETIFNRCDDFAAYPEADRTLIANCEQRLLRSADHVLYVSQSLLEKERSVVQDAVYLGHGVDYDRFSEAAAQRTASTPPSALNGIQRPVVGYYGLLDDFRIDLDLMVKIARHVAPRTFLLLGPKMIDITRLTREPNVTYLGPIPHDHLATYAAQFDVGIMPFLKNSFNAACNPIKMKEYLALGFPIVAMRFPALEPYEDVVYTADSHDEFLLQLDKAMDDINPANVAARRQYVRNDDWSHLADRVADFFSIPHDDAPSNASVASQPSAAGVENPR